MQNPQTWRAGRLLFVWPLTFDLSGMGVPTRTSRGPANIALGLIGARKHPHHVKVAIFGRGCPKICPGNHPLKYENVTFIFRCKRSPNFNSNIRSFWAVQCNICYFVKSYLKESNKCWLIYFLLWTAFFHYSTHGKKKSAPYESYWKKLDLLQRHNQYTSFKDLRFWPVEMLQKKW